MIQLIASINIILMEKNKLKNEWINPNACGNSRMNQVHSNEKVGKIFHPCEIYQLNEEKQN